MSPPAPPATACRASTRAAISEASAMSARDHHQPEGIVSKSPFATRHARLHRQAEGRGYPEAAGLHPGHRGRDPAKVTKSSPGARKHEPGAHSKARRAARSSRAALCRQPCRGASASSEHQAFLDQHPAAVLDLLDLGDRIGDGRSGELGRRRVEDVEELSPDSSASIIFWPVRSLPALLA